MESFRFPPRRFVYKVCKRIFFGGWCRLVKPCGGRQSACRRARKVGFHKVSRPQRPSEASDGVWAAGAYPVTNLGFFSPESVTTRDYPLEPVTTRYGRESGAEGEGSFLTRDDRRPRIFGLLALGVGSSIMRLVRAWFALGRCWASLCVFRSKTQQGRANPSEWKEKKTARF